MNRSIVGYSAPSEIIWDQSDIVFLQSGVERATSNSVVQIDFWFNVSYYPNTTRIVLYYYNGTHGPYFNDTISSTQGDTNFDQWWTGYYDFEPADFSSDTLSPLVATIPYQNALTQIDYQITISYDNGVSFENHTNSYTVLYSSQEVQQEAQIFMAQGLYWTASLIMIAIILFLRPIYLWTRRLEGFLGFLILWTRSILEVNPSDEHHELEEEGILNRINHLDVLTHYFRTGANFILVISIGFFIWVYPLFDIFPATTLGTVILIVMVFLSIIRSFSNTDVVLHNSRLSYGLVPRGVNRKQYRNQLNVLITVKEIMLGQMRGMISAGIGIFVYLFLVDSGLFLLPRLDSFQGRWILTIPYWIYQVLLALFVLLVANAFLGKYGLSLGGVNPDEMVTTLFELIDESPEIRELLVQSLSGTEEIEIKFKKQISQKLLEYYKLDELPSEIRDLIAIQVDETDSISK